MATLALTSTVATLTAAASASLPDGRVYEQVSPPYKNGNFVDFAGLRAIPLDFGVAEAGGDAVLYPLTGAAGAADSGTIGEYVSRRVPGHDWSTMQTTPRQFAREFNVFNEAPTTLMPSVDFTKFLFASPGAYTRDDQAGSLNVFLSEDPAREPEWISQPQVANPIPGLGESIGQNYVVAGASADLGTVYLGYAGTLLPEDAARAPYVRGGHSEGKPAGFEGQPAGFEDEPWGFYEWSGGALREAGTLPDGKLSPFGAVPASANGLGDNGRRLEFQAGSYDNWMSGDGGRALFVSPDPVASSVSNPKQCAITPPCSSEAPQLYMREALAGGGHRVMLVSHSMLPGQEGSPAPDGPVLTGNPTGMGATYVFGTPDESRVFFASTDFLTVAAQEANVSGVKEYEYETSTGGLTYLSGVHGSIAAVDGDGSKLVFLNSRLELWRTGAGGGTVTPIAEMPEPGDRGLSVRSSQFSADGSTFVFTTNSRIPGSFNNGGANVFGASPFELYRYDAASGGGLTCVSCPPAGVTPTGDTYTSYNNRLEHQGIEEEEVQHFNGTVSDPQTTVETRAVSADGSRVFFDTPNAVVAQDTNGVRDVYEWESGAAHLISSGGGREGSFYVDSSESGGDVFFATTAALAPDDTDEAGDVYDARIPRPGDDPPPAGVPCKGSVCQGPPGVPQLLGAPASATFSGAGNLASVAPSLPTSVEKCPKGKRLSHGRCVKRKKAKKKTKKKAGNGRRVKR